MAEPGRSIPDWVLRSLLPTCIVVCGCATSDGGGAGGADGAELRVVATTPANMASDVPTDVLVSAALDAALQEATVTETTFTLSRGEEPVRGTVTLVSEATAAFLQGGPLALLAQHTATLTTDIESLAGGTLAADHRWVFTTRDGQWGTEELIQTDNEDPGNLPRLAVNPDGQALAVWVQLDPARSQVWANHHTPATGWGVAQRIDTTNQSDARAPQVAIDPSGNGIAVWQQSDGSHESVWANRYTVDGGWGTVELIETGDAGDVNPAGVVVDAGGNGLAAWSQSDGVGGNVWANRFTPAGGWRVAERIDGNNSNNGSSPSLAINANGDAIAVWGQVDGPRRYVWANFYTPAVGWGVPQSVEDNEAGPAGSMNVAIDPNGDAIAVWVQDDGGEYNVVWANHYDSESGWGTPEEIHGNDPSNAGAPQVAVALSGAALAVWPQVDAVGVWANRYTPNEGWGVAQQIDPEAATVSKTPQIAVDANGNALSMWVRDGGGGFDAIWWSRYTPADGWGEAERFRPDAEQRAHSPRIAIDSRGNGVALWYEEITLNQNIWSARFE